MKKVLIIIYVLLIFSSVCSTINAHKMVERFESHKTEQLNPIEKKMDEINKDIYEINRDMDEANSSKQISEPKSVTKNSLVKTAIYLWVFDRSEFNNISGPIITSTVLWIMVVIVSVIISIKTIGSNGMPGYMIPLFGVIIFIGLMFAIYFGLYVIILIFAIIVGFVSAVSD